MQRIIKLFLCFITNYPSMNSFCKYLLVFLLLLVRRMCRYDFHRGVDIPIQVGTPVVAIDNGTVRIAGSDPAYSDGVVQV